MDLGSINWLAVLVCIIVSMITASLWYNPRTFFPAWWKGIGRTEKDQPGAGSDMAMTWGLTVFASFVQAVAMAFMVNAIAGRMPGGPTLASGASVGFMLWLWLHRANLPGEQAIRRLRLEGLGD